MHQNTLDGGTPACMRCPPLHAGALVNWLKAQLELAPCAIAMCRAIAHHMSAPLHHQGHDFFRCRAMQRRGTLTLEQLTCCISRDGQTPSQPPSTRAAMVDIEAFKVLEKR